MQKLAFCSPKFLAAMIHWDSTEVQGIHETAVIWVAAGGVEPRTGDRLPSSSSEDQEEAGQESQVGAPSAAARSLPLYRPR